MMTKKYHNQELTYKRTEKTMNDVSLERIKKVDGKYLTPTRPIFALVVDNGRMILTFLTVDHYEQFMMNTEVKNKYGDTWIQFGEQKSFTFTDGHKDRTVIVAEFKTEELMDEELGNYYEGMTNAHFGLKEDTGRYSKYDVYSESELL